MAIVIYEEDGLVSYTVGATPDDTFTIPFTFTVVEDVIVFVDEVVETGVTITGAGVKTGEGTREAVLDTPVSNVIVTIARDVDIIRATSFLKTNPIGADRVDLELDRIFLILQDLQRQIFDYGLDGLTLDAQGKRIINVADPIDPQDAATKNYVDSAIAGVESGTVVNDITYLGDIVYESYVDYNFPVDYFNIVSYYDEVTYESTIVYNGGISQQIATYTLTAAATVTPDQADTNRHEITLQGDGTIGDPANLLPGQFIVLHLVQDGTGGRLVAWGSAYKFPGDGSPPVINAGPNEPTIVYGETRTVSGTTYVFVNHTLYPDPTA